MKLGCVEEGKEQYKKFLMFAYIVDGYAAVNFETVKKEYADNFGDRLNCRWVGEGWYAPYNT